jgi:hypothetical protein
LNFLGDGKASVRDQSKTPERIVFPTSSGFSFRAMVSTSGNSGMRGFQLSARSHQLIAES